MAASLEKITELLGNGLSNDVVANAVGVHPSYISQLMSDGEFAEKVITLRTQSLTAATSRDRTWDTVEDLLVNKLTVAIENDMIYKPIDLLKAASIANGAKRRGSSSTQALTVNNTVVTLNIPTVVVNAYKTNSNKEVIEVTSDTGTQQTLVTMPAAALMQQLAEKHQGHKQYEQVRKYLPTGSTETEIER